MHKASNGARISPVLARPIIVQDINIRAEMLGRVYWLTEQGIGGSRTLSKKPRLASEGAWRMGIVVAGKFG
jgi:hypothetical protein